VAFGDSSNDLEMLRDAGLGVCMQNGRDDVKAVANRTSHWTNDEDGVGREIEALLESGAFD
jgi:hydroxymethylpyrimidine pyrophosphatase-like HAD family hydrolase